MHGHALTAHTAVNNANTKYGVLCHYNNNYISKCSPGTSTLLGGRKQGKCVLHAVPAHTKMKQAQATCKTCNSGTYNETRTIIL